MSANHLDSPTRRRLSEPMLDVVVASVVGLLTVLVVGLTAQNLGFTRDEGYYFKAGEFAADWWRLLVTSPTTALSADGINAHLAYNPEHPFLMKGLFGLAQALNGLLHHLGLGVDGANAMRFPAWCVGGLAVALVYGLARPLTSRAGAITAALLFVSMPRVFWHLHLACFDIAAVAAHAGLVLAYWFGRQTRWQAVVVGAVFGLAAATKHNVLPVPALFVLHWLITERPWRRPLRVPLVFVGLAVVGPVVYVLLWPYLWPDVVHRFGAYLAFHLRHEHYPILYFGELLTAPPFPMSFPLVMWAVTIPVASLAAIAIGIWQGASVVVADRPRRHRLPDSPWSATSSLVLLYALNVTLPVVLIALPSSPIFGGTKHWMNALPFLCALGGAGLVAALRETVDNSRWARNVAHSLPGAFFARSGVVVVVVGIVIAPAIWATAHGWPYGLGSYNELAGFSRGAANLGLQRTFWGYESRAVWPLLNERLPKRLHHGDVNADAHRRQQADGLLDQRIQFHGNVNGADAAWVEPQGEFRQQQLDVWNLWGRRDPDVIVDVDGVPIGTLTFRRRQL